MDNIVVGESSDVGTLFWLADAFAYTSKHDQSKLHSYLRMVSEDVEFEMGLDVGRR